MDVSVCVKCIISSIDEIAMRAIQPAAPGSERSVLYAICALKRP